jgi:hypothetical protein
MNKPLAKITNNKVIKLEEELYMAQPFRVFWEPPSSTAWILMPD